MPELPEVETIRRELAKVLVGKTITKALVLWPKTVAPLGVDRFVTLVTKKKVVSLDRLAKILFINLSGPASLAFHLKMTGQLIFIPKSGEIVVGGHPDPAFAPSSGVAKEKVLPNSHTRLILTFSDQSKLYFNDMRKFGWARLVNDDETKLLTGNTGPDPLSKHFTVPYFTELFKKYPKHTIKQILMDQTLIAGIGNIYADEAAFLAKLIPDRKAATVKPSNIEKLHEAIIEVLKLSIKNKGTSSRNYVRSTGEPGGFVPFLFVYGRSGLPCKICGTMLKKIRHNGRGTVYCPKCQR